MIQEKGKMGLNVYYVVSVLESVLKKLWIWNNLINKYTPSFTFWYVLKYNLIGGGKYEWML